MVFVVLGIELRKPHSPPGLKNQLVRRNDAVIAGQSKAHRGRLEGQGTISAATGAVENHFQARGERRSREPPLAIARASLGIVLQA